jgi:hypothetical protein
VQKWVLIMLHIGYLMSANHQVLVQCC